MRIDIAKSPKLISTLIALSVGIAAYASQSEVKKPSVAATATSTVIPNMPEALAYSDFLSPLPLAQDHVITHPNGVIVNLTKGIDLAVSLPNLRVVNTDPRFGLNLGKGDLNITYLLPQSFQAEKDRQDALKLVEQQYPLLMSLLITQQGVNSSGTLRFSVISVADAFKASASRINDLDKNNRLLPNALGVELSHAYLALTRARIFDLAQTPKVYPNVPADLRILLNQGPTYPLGVTSFNRDYLVALGIIKPKYN